jgi:SAM-dependent methyltransferase
MAELPIDLEFGLSERLSRILDVEGKIPRALEALGPIAGRDVLLLDGTDGIRARQLRDLGARVAFAGAGGAGGSVGFGAPDASADVVLSLWSSFRGAAPAELAEARRVLRRGGRLLIVHDYGRDDVSHLRGELPEYSLWSRRGGPFLSDGFKVRVVHCFWTFDSIEAGGDFLAAAFADAGRDVASVLKRPRLSYNVAIYHRTFGEASPSEPSGTSR